MGNRNGNGDAKRKGYGRVTGMDYIEGSRGTGKDNVEVHQKGE